MEGTEYEENLARGEAYQLYIKDVWRKAFPLICKRNDKYEDISDTIIFYDTKHEQYNIGESVQGIEVKLDARSRETGNLYIEVAESQKPNSPMCASGIYRKDNTVTWIIGTYEYAYIIPKQLLIQYREKQNPKLIEKTTSKGFLINMQEADYWASHGHIIKLNIKTAIASNVLKEKRYTIAYLKNKYYITDISLNNLNKNNMSNQQEAFENKFILAGKIYQIGQEQTFASGFRKRTIVLQDKVYAENMFQFEVHKDRCDELDKFKEGDNVKVHFNVRCNDYKGKFYTNLVAWRLEKMSTADAVAGADGAFKDEFGATHYDDKKEDGEDLDLPF